MADGEVVIDTSLDPSGFEKGLGKLGSLTSTGLKATTAAITAVSTALSACAAYCIKVGSDFEAGMSKVEAISGASSKEVVTATGEIIDGYTALSEKAIEMGDTTKFSATECTEALNYMAMAGWEPQQMYDGLAGVMTLAAASGENLANTSNILTDALTAFGLTASDSSHFADVLAQVSAKANTNVGELGEAFKYVAPLCGALGYSVEDASIALGLMANSGIHAGQAGTALRAALTNMASPTDKMAAKMDALGISLVNTDGTSKSLIDVLKNLREGFSDLSETEKTAAASTIFGKEAMTGMIAILNASDEDFAKLTASIYDCDEAASDMAAIMQDNLQGAMTNLSSKVSTLGIRVYQELQEPLKNLAIKGQEYIKQLTTAFEAGGFSGLVSELGVVLADILQQIAEFGPKIIEAATGLVHSFCEGIKSADGISDAGSKLVLSFATALASCAGDMWSTAITLIGQFVAGLASGADQLVGAAVDCISTILDSLISQLPAILSAGMQILDSLVQGLIQNLPRIGEQALQIISILFQALLSGIPKIAELGISLINSLAESIGSSLPQLIPQALEALVTFSGTLRKNVGLLVDAGLNLIQNLAKSFIDNIPVIIATVPTIITNLCGCINDNGPKLLQTGLELIFQLGVGLIKAIPDLIANIPQIIEAVVAVFAAFNWLQLGQNLIKWIGDGIKNLADLIPNAMKNIGQTAKNFLTNIEWSQLGSNIITFIGNGISSLMSAIPNLLMNIGRTALDGFRSINWASVGSNLIQGICSGVASAASILVNAAVNAAKNALQAVKNWLGIRSPSRRAKDEIGKFILPGIGEGVEESEPELNEKMEDAADDMITSFGDRTRDIDVSGLVAKMKSGVDREVGSISTDVTVRTRSGSGQVDHTADEGMDYDRIGASVARALIQADVKVECDDREVGRLISDHIPK